VTDRQKRRRWSDEEKRVICAQARLSGVSVSQVARRYAVNANQVFNWLKDARFQARQDVDEASCFLPVEIVAPVPRADERPAAIPQASDGVIEIALAGGHRLSISGAYDPDALARLIRKLSG